MKFLPQGTFHQDLKTRVDEYFAQSGKRERDLPGMYLKSAIILSWFAGSWAFLVFGATGPWTALLGCVSLALAMAGIGFSVQHDANHGGYSDHALVNDTFGYMLDVLGGSSYIWRWKHNIFHHSHPNVEGLDGDIEAGALGRLSPDQKLRSIHRYQHVYIWFLYGFLAIKWHLVDDIVNVFKGVVPPQRFPRPRGWHLVKFVGGKLFFLSWAFVIPALFHPLWQVAVAYFVTSFLLGMTLSTIFQLAHCVEEAEFPALPQAGAGGRFESDWAVHQINTTVDFGSEHRILTWYLGGLNYQVVHHLFPHVCHLHYPAISKILAATCRAHGVTYRTHRSIRSAFASHARWLARMGREVAPDAVPLRQAA